MRPKPATPNFFNFRKQPRLISRRSSHRDLRGGIVQQSTSVAAHLAISSTKVFGSRRYFGPQPLAHPRRCSSTAEKISAR